MQCMFMNKETCEKLNYPLKMFLSFSPTELELPLLKEYPIGLDCYLFWKTEKAKR